MQKDDDSYFFVTSSGPFKNGSVLCLIYYSSFVYPLKTFNARTHARTHADRQTERSHTERDEVWYARLPSEPKPKVTGTENKQWIHTKVRTTKKADLQTIFFSFMAKITNSKGKNHHGKQRSTVAIQSLYPGLFRKLLSQYERNDCDYDRNNNWK